MQIHDTLLLERTINNGINIIELDKIYPLGKIKYKGNIKVNISCDGINYENIIIEDSFNDVTARYIKIESDITQKIKIYVGLGYIATKNIKFEKHFINKHGWSGADGIYSFNIENNEDYNQLNDKTLFVFGDTFVGHVDDNNARIEPTAMVNNSLAYYKNGKLEFEIAKDAETGSLKSLIVPDNYLKLYGYVAKNLTTYLGDIYIPPFVSALDFNKDIEIYFDLRDEHKVVKIDIENYHDSPQFGVSSDKRSTKIIDVYAKNDELDYKFIKRINLDNYSKEKPFNSYDFDIDARFIKFVIPCTLNNNGNLNGDNVVGLKKVYFHGIDCIYYDVVTTSNTSYFDNYKKIWFWLQDGIIVNNKFHIFPCIVEDDLNGIEGFEFKLDGVAHIIMDIENQKIKYENATITSSPLYQIVGDREYVLPIAIYQEGDYAYFYGYYNERSLFLRHLIVGRILKNKLDDLNNIEYFDGTNWQNDMSKAASLLEHVSCEMSVQKIIEGENKGKYLAIFQYDTNGPKVAYAIGKSICGPFTKPRIVYVADEITKYNKTTYTYNAKSHLHLSTPRNILVSYNTNDMSMKCNKADFSIYHPRFLNLEDTSK